MHILFTRFPLESALGGAEIQTLSLMDGLMERGHTVTFAGSCPTLLPECRKRKIPTIELGIGKPPVTKFGTVSFTWRKAKMRAKLKTMFESFENEKSGVKSGSRLKTHNSQLDVIVMLSLSEKLLLTDIAADAGINVVWVEHDRIGNWLTKNPWLAMLLRQAQKAVTVTVSELSRGMYLKLGWDAKRVIAIPNGVELRGRTAASYEKHSKLEARSSKLRLGCIARLSPEKGVDLLIRAMTNVPQNIILEIIGTGREEQSLKDLTHTLKLDDRITFTEHEHDVGTAFARWDALVLPSRDNDPFGMAAAEAMLAGLPVIVTDQCGIAGYLKNNIDAIVVEANSSSAIAGGIQRLRATSGACPELCRRELRENGQKTAEEKFSVKMMVNQYEDVFTLTPPSA